MQFVKLIVIYENICARKQSRNDLFTSHLTYFNELIYILQLFVMFSFLTYSLVILF